MLNILNSVKAVPNLEYKHGNFRYKGHVIPDHVAALACNETCTIDLDKITFGMNTLIPAEIIVLSNRILDVVNIVDETTWDIAIACDVGQMLRVSKNNVVCNHKSLLKTLIPEHKFIVNDFEKDGCVSIPPEGFLPRNNNDKYPESFIGEHDEQMNMVRTFRVKYINGTWHFSTDDRLLVKLNESREGLVLSSSFRLNRFFNEYINEIVKRHCERLKIIRSYNIDNLVITSLDHPPLTVGSGFIPLHHISEKYNQVI